METKQLSWYAFEIMVDAGASEAIEFALNESGALGTEINNLGKDKPKETLCVAGYFNEKPAGEFLQNEIAEALRIYGFSSDVIKNSEWRTVENKDWLAEWKKSWQPTETGKFIVAPAWLNIPDAPEKIIIRIEPNMAFGTGTGILAIAAAKMKSKSQSPKSKVEGEFTQHSALSTQHSFLACDTDADSVKIARENAEINGVKNIEFYVGSIAADTPRFDFVCANLTADVIVPLLPLLTAKFKKTLLLSGILKEQEDWVVGELNSKFKIQNSKFKIQTDGEWISILAVNGEL